MASAKHQPTTIYGDAEHTLPFGIDGLSAVQRALLRVIAKANRPVHGSRLLSDLMEAPDRPADLTPADIDAAALTCAHPLLCNHPLLTYQGYPGSAEGWIPGGHFRSFGLTETVLRGAVLIDSKSAWDPAPLRVTAPWLLVAGHATWAYTLERPDAGLHSLVRLSCTRVHCLGVGWELVAGFMTRRHARDTAAESSAARSSGRVPYYGVGLAELRPTTEPTMQGFPVPKWPNEPSGGLPHGVLAAVELGRKTGEDRGLVVCSNPRITWRKRRSSRWPLEIVVLQPACGQTLGDAANRLVKLGYELARGEAASRPPYAVLRGPAAAVDLAALCVRVPLSGVAGDRVGRVIV